MPHIQQLKRLHLLWNWDSSRLSHLQLFKKVSAWRRSDSIFGKGSRQNKMINSIFIVNTSQWVFCIIPANNQTFLVMWFWKNIINRSSTAQFVITSLMYRNNQRIEKIFHPLLPLHTIICTLCTTTIFTSLQSARWKVNFIHENTFNFNSLQHLHWW